MRDPAGLGMAELDNTPWWVTDNRRGTGQGLGRCNPFGYEDAAVRVMGGLADPRREAYAWRCENWADGKYRMTCTEGHSGIVVLCYGHVHMIQKRMNGVCPRCAWPSRARELDEVMNGLMREIPAVRGEDRRWRLAKLEWARQEMNELIARGEVRTGAPLRLVEVS